MYVRSTSGRGEKNDYTIFVGKRERKRILIRRWEDNDRMDFGEVEEP
jgi:hypothetical protein